jgi:hypothetical protein
LASLEFKDGPFTRLRSGPPPYLRRAIHRLAGGVCPGEPEVAAAVHSAQGRAEAWSRPLTRTERVALVAAAGRGAVSGAVLAVVRWIIEQLHQ